MNARSWRLRWCPTSARNCSIRSGEKSEYRARLHGVRRPLTGNHGGFWPTVETAAFILAGEDLERRFEVQRLFDPDATLRKAKLLQLEERRWRRASFRRR